VPYPTPVPGLVIRYAYLWRAEYRRGQEEGLKDRPCAVVLVSVDEDGDDIVTVLPINHMPPLDPADAVEIPADTKRRLRLDDDRSWIVLTEANEFLWPGPDLRPCRPADPESIAFGLLPGRFFKHVQERFLRKRRSIVPRTE
jgi:hypothetical protein